MKKRRLDFIFLFIILLSIYAFFFTSIDVHWKYALVGLYGVIIFICMYSLMLENRTPESTLVWMYVLFFFPVAGFFFYLYSGQLYLKGHMFKKKRMHNREMLRKMADKETTPDLSPLQSHQRYFAQYLQCVSLTKMNVHTKTYVLKNGQETFNEIKKHLQSAKQFIHMEYYMFHSDSLGKEIIDILIKKASEGIEVRFTFDTMGSFTLSGSDIKRMKKANIKVHPFLPIKYGFFNQKFNFRNHRKIVVIDGEVGFVGGLNVGDQYLRKKQKNWFLERYSSDAKRRICSNLAFNLYVRLGYVSGECLINNEAYTKTSSCRRRRLCASGGDGAHTQENMSDYYYTMITSATKSIWISTPYFVPNEAIRTALRIAARKGVEVRIMVPEINDGFLTQYGTRSYFAELLRCGIEVYSYRKGFLHQKIVIIDGDMASVGTANMDMRSFHLNFEVNAFLIEGETIQTLIKFTKKILKTVI